MLYYRDGQFHICPFIAHYLHRGQRQFKYTNDKQWWTDFVNRWWHHKDLEFTSVTPTQAQLDRLAEINNAEISEGFKSGASMYVESGKLPKDEAGNIEPPFESFTESPGEIFPDPAPAGTLQTNKWTMTADGVEEALVAYSTKEASINFYIEDQMHSVASEQKFNGKFAILEVSADSPGPIKISVQDKIITLMAEA